MQPLARGAQLDLGGPVGGVLGEGGDGLPVQHPLRGRANLPAARAETAQQGGKADVHADQHDAVGQRGQVQVGGAGDLHSVDVDELVVEHVAGEQHLTRAAPVFA
ncbi:hypothetical protein [Streptomyces sp. NPDC001137]|uniref:hypothetical protein n=1 Tax=Streptomyces sp. NPDC001137 TaxID=3154378 RepID=UPI003317624D